MATVNKRPSGKWQAIVRKDGGSHSKTFTKRADAVKWARETEMLAEQGLLQHTAAGVDSNMSLGQVLERYRDEVTSKKRCVENETYAINGFMRSCRKLSVKRIDKLTTADFVAHREQRVRRQGFWDRERPNLRERLAHLVGLIMRRAVGDASVAFRVSFV